MSQKWNALSDADFRREVRSFIESNYPAHLRFSPQRPRWETLKPWVMALVERGWSAPNWPVVYGGMGLCPSKLLIFMDEQERWGVGRPPDHGIVQLGPMLIRFGTPDQRERLLPPMRRYETRWCQGYSEPNAGSDLASLTTEAVSDGAHFIINGSKIWTSVAYDATHIYLLARTNKEVRKQQGISFFLVDMSTPGVSLRGIRNISGSTEFCEVRFDGVRVPASNLVGELNAGWDLAKGLLSFERVHNGNPRRAQFAFHRLEELARERGLYDNAAFMRRFTELRLDLSDLESLYAYFAAQLTQHGELGQDVSVLKIISSETCQKILEFMLEAAGDTGAVFGNQDRQRLDALTPFLFARSFTIGSGTTEIQRNIVAKQVLNLPS